MAPALADLPTSSPPSRRRCAACCTSWPGARATVCGGAQAPSLFLFRVLDGGGAVRCEFGERLCALRATGFVVHGPCNFFWHKQRRRRRRLRPHAPAPHRHGGPAAGCGGARGGWRRRRRRQPKVFYYLFLSFSLYRLGDVFQSPRLTSLSPTRREIWDFLHISTPSSTPHPCKGEKQSRKKKKGP